MKTLGQFKQTLEWKIVIYKIPETDNSSKSEYWR